MDIGTSTRVAKARHNMTTNELAERLGVDRRRIWMLCNAKPGKHFNSETIERLADAFEMRVSDFIALGEEG